MKSHPHTRLLSLLLVIAMLAGFAAPAAAAGSRGKVTYTQVDNDSVSAGLLNEPVETVSDAPEYADTDVVRVSIVLEEQSTVAAGFSTKDIAKNAEAMSYRADLQKKQEAVTTAIERRVGGKLDVVWNLTLAANIISANVEYGKIPAIEKVPGVARVFVENQYDPMVLDSEEAADPNMATSSAQIGSTTAWASGYTGAGSRIAIIDTGTDENHQSFDAGAFEYSLAYQAGKSGMELEEYLDSLDLLDAEQIASVADKLNAASGALDAQTVYVNSKIPYGYNYVDRNYDTTHVNDYVGDHGSHVSGIAAANAYVPNEDGTYTKALNAVCVQGVAPDAQIITMKVFGKRGGAYDSDYTAAIEDAIILGCDAVNLSLGAANPGPSKELNYEYQHILDSLSESGTVVAISAGNSGNWVENSYTFGYLYNTDVNMQTDGSPGSYTNSLAVASVDNDGTTGYCVSVGDVSAVYFESVYKNEAMTTLMGDHEYVLIDGLGTAEDWAALGDAVEGKIALCSRGETPFYEKAELAVEAGAIGVIIYNNMPGVLGMDLTDYSYTAPVVSISQDDAAAIRTVSETVTDEEGNVLYYTGTMTVGNEMATSQFGSDYYTMSTFSSWGTPGSLELKPEITAPGGSIYSVYGQTKENAGVDTYKVNSGTSMASPQVAGMSAVVAQYIRENDLCEKTGLTARQLTQSLLMSTSVPMVDGNSGCYYPVIQQGSGLGNVGAAVCADTYILMGEDATDSWFDGKVKAELGDDPDKTGVYTFTFSIHNMTDLDKAYVLSADFFTQDVFQYYANDNYSMDELAYYMDTYCTALDAITTFSVDGQPLEPAGDVTGLDFNGDGAVNAADGQTLLDYATGVTNALSNLDRADLDADGDVDTHDAYLFFTRIENALVVPADGSVDVTVTAVLSDDQKAHLDAYYPNGAYVEGYVFAEGASTAEGLLGTAHSIPVLGFYGNWSDPSMFDVGSRQEYMYGEETRLPYLGSTESNYFTVSYPDEPDVRYYFSGNPLIPDAVYMPERNAINSGSTISGVQFTAIRNAVASRVTGVNDTTGEVLNDLYPGSFDAAYYNISYGRWNNSSYSQIIKIPFDTVSEGDHVTVSLTLAPEYYLHYVPKVDENGETLVDDNGSVQYDQVIDWDALGEGATMSVPMVVDNTAPELKAVYHSLMDNTLVVSASDNQYIAAVTLYNKAGSKLYAYAGAKQDIEAGENAEFVLDLSEVNGSRFLLQVTDYAMNTTTYLLETQIGDEEPLPKMILFDATYNFWTTFDKNDEFVYAEGNPEYSPTDLTFYAAAIIDHMVLASTDTGDLYIMPEDDLMSETFIRSMGVVVTDMAYSKTDKTLYGVADGKLVTIDKSTGAVTEIGQIGIDTMTLAVDANGTFYCHENNDESAVYSFTLDTLDEPTRLIDGIQIETYNWGTMRATGVQTMEIDPETGLLCWASYIPKGWMSMFIEIDTKTGEYTVYTDRWDKFTSLIFPEGASGGGGWTSPTDEVSEITISNTSLSMLKRGEAVLTANVLPWNASDRTVTWSSSDESVATVDQFGNVCALADGEATITATSNLDPTFSASCVVTVESVDVTISGVVQDADGEPQFYTWDLKNDETWTGGNAIDTVFTSAAYNAEDDVYYVMDSVDNSWVIHEMGADGVTDKTGTNTTGYPLWDMTYSKYYSEQSGTDLIHGVYRYYLYAAKDPMNVDKTARFSLSGKVGMLTGIATVGYEQYFEETTQAWLDTEHVVMLDKNCRIFNLWIYRDDEGQKAYYTRSETDLPCKFPSDSTGKHMYSSLAVGDDGTVYVSAFNGSTNELYRMLYDETTEMYHAEKICDFGEGVWPASITSVVANAPDSGAEAAVPQATDHMVAEIVSVDDTAETEPETAGSEDVMDVEAKLALVESWFRENTGSEAAETSTDLPMKPLSDTDVDSGEQTVTVNITAAAAVNNGLAIVTYDADKLHLTNVGLHGDYTSKVEGEGAITFGYVSMNEIAAGSTIATLTFQAAEAVDSTVTVEHKQVNNTAGATEELKVEFTHANTEVRDAVAATCTTAGYTGDTYCSDCGALVEKGRIVEALGHEFSDWTVTKAATCTEHGEQTHTCAVCGHTETDFIPAAGHDYAAETVEPTCTEGGYTTYTCTVCGDSHVADFVDAPGHSYETVVTEPTCTEQGYTTYTCAVCGESHVADYVDPDCASAHFIDVSADDWFHEAVDYVVEKNLMNGVSETAFAPDSNMNRAQIVTVLYRMAGSPEVEATDTFVDVPADTFYTNAVAWAVANGITNGVSETAFDPNGSVTREQMVTFLYRYEKLSGADMTTVGDLSAYEDADAVSTWAVDAMVWAVENGVITGVTETTLEPASTTNRAQVATVLMRCCTAE